MLFSLAGLPIPHRNHDHYGYEKRNHDHYVNEEDYDADFEYTVQSFDSPHDSSSGVASDLTSPPSPPKALHRDVRQKPPRRSAAMRKQDYDSSSGDSCLNRTPKNGLFQKYPLEPKIYLSGSDQGSIDPPSDYSSGNPSSITCRELQETGHLISCLKKQPRQIKFSPFDFLSDDVVVKIFSSLSTEDLCRCSRVCRRWYNLAWEPSIWTTLSINNGQVNVDQALKYLTRRLSYDTPYVCVSVQNINLNGCDKLTDKGLQLIANRCPELINLDLQGCSNITNWAIFDVVSKCTNLERLNLLGCSGITCISLTPEASLQASPLRSKQIFLHFLDMTDCSALEDGGLSIIASHCTNLQYLYLRRCVRITDIGVQYIANYCTLLKELSISDCRRVTDFGVRELSKLESSLRYLSVAKCDKISDVGIKYVAKYCYKLRYLNARGCEAVSDDSVVNITRYCRRLRSLDIGKCDVTDEGLIYLAENCPQLRKLSLKSCDGVTDAGVIAIAFNMKHLHQLNIQDCHLSVESYRAVKKYCKHCIIEHTNPGFY